MKEDKQFVDPELDLNRNAWRLMRWRLPRRFREEPPYRGRKIRVSPVYYPGDDGEPELIWWDLP